MLNVINLEDYISDTDIYCLIISGSPAILGDREEDIDGDDNASDFNYPSEEQNQKQKAPERMLSWHMTYGRGEDAGPPKYDNEVPHNHIPLLTNGQEVINKLRKMFNCFQRIEVKLISSFYQS